MQAAVADMVAATCRHIVNIISVSATADSRTSRHTSAAKAGLIGLTRNAAHAHRWDRIRINGLNIGWTETEGEDETQRRFHGGGADWADEAAASLPMGKLGQPGEIAEMVVFCFPAQRGGDRLGNRLGSDR